MACSALRWHHELVFRSVKCWVHPDYGSCRLEMINKTHIDCDVVAASMVYDPYMDLVIAQVDASRRSRTVILSRKFDLCDKNTYGKTDYASLYVVSIINSFLNGTKFECPLSPRKFAIRSFTLTSKFVPWQLFYRRNSYLIVNGSFFEVKQNSKKKVGSYLLNTTIEKTPA
ncbi:unnamed protein product [Hermetia illucens]|uniref:Uncharacterized protein n=2 Tax=Hermetia illucens TaxID=343691 RepID=A0A7R8Z1D5_HERIL|nr:unnamed protein product [Hermetia illucens]